jgi:hypothetical protein
MKRAGIITAVVIGVLVFVVWGVRAAIVDFTWDYDYTVDIACVDAAAVDCVEGFEILSESGATLLAVPNQTPVPAGAVVDIPAQLITGPPYGNRTFGLIAVARDGSGARVVSETVSFPSALIRPGKPTNLRAQ